MWGWARAVRFVLDEEAWDKLPQLKSVFDTFSARPAAQRADAIKARHALKTNMDDVARRSTSPQTERLKAG